MPAHPKTSDNRKRARTVAEMQAENRARRLAKEQETAELTAATEKAKKRTARADKVINDVTTLRRSKTLALKRAENTEAQLAQAQSEIEALKIELAARAAPSPDDQYRLLARTDVEDPMTAPRGPSENTRSARKNLYDAFELLGGVEWLVEQGKKYPLEFMRTWARLIPTEAEEDSKKLPLEVLLSMLDQRRDMSVQDATADMAEELLADAVAAHRGTLQ